MIGKIAMATATLATAAMMSAAPAAAGAGAGRYYDADNDRVRVEIGYSNRRYNDYDRGTAFGRNHRSRGQYFGGNRRYQRQARLTPLQRHRRILRNRGGVKAWKVKQRLKNRGFYNVRIRDNLLPIYTFRACRNGKRFTISTNRFGEVRGKNKTGRCGNFGRRNHHSARNNYSNY